MSFNLFDFQGRILLNKLVNMHESATNPNLNLVSFFNFNINAFLSELVNAFRLSQEKDVHLLSLWELVDKVSQRYIDIVILFRDVNGLILL